MADDAAREPKRSRVHAGPIIGAALVLLAIAGLAWWHYQGRESTDDAQVDGHVTQVAARTGGVVISVGIKENQVVKAGDVLVQVDPAEYRVALDRARAELADAEATAEAARTGVPITQTTSASDVRTAQGTVQQAQATIDTAVKEVDAARARLASAQARQREKQAEADRTQRDLDRLEGLIEKDEISRQQYDAAVAAAAAARASAQAEQAAVSEAAAGIRVADSRLTHARASATQAQAALDTARTGPEQVSSSRARAQAAEARVAQARAAVERAKLDLDHTTIVAPANGTISKKAVEPGQFVQPGQPLFAIVSLDEVWVTANFKETQLQDIRVGQSAVVEVDAYGGREYRGRVDSIAAATGARFSLLPPENATGNYVKVVQRVPIKIVLEPGQDPEHLLRPGMSVVPTVYTR
jgi:membrane fusion protein (multidrug efflux system)